MWPVTFCCIVFLGSVFCITSDDFLLFSITDTGGLIYQVNLATESMNKISVKYSGFIESVAYDPSENKVYFTDGENIRNMHLNGTGEEIVGQWDTLSHCPVIKLDYISRLLYHMEYTGKTVITLMTMDGSHQFPIITSSEFVTDIALDPAHGMIYWSGIRGITSAAMDGTHQSVFINTNGTVENLAIDLSGEVLYWRQTLSDSHIILSAPLNHTTWVVNGSVWTPQVLTKSAASEGGMTFLGNNLFYSEKINSLQSRIAKFKVTRADEIVKHVQHQLYSFVSSITSYSSTGDSVLETSCSKQNGGCNHVCVPTPKGSRCACPDGFNHVSVTKCSLATYSCPQEYREQRGRIQNPGYPFYRNNTHCEIIVRVDNRYFKELRIFLYVEEFDLQNDHDFLLIDRKPVELHHQDNYTVHLTPDDRDSHWLFVTDSSVVKRGFSIIYQIHQVTHCGSESQCLHGGTCVDEEFCVCPYNYTGNRCEHVEYNPCHSLPCLNRGQCEKDKAGYKCLCRPGTTGKQCQHVDHCASFTCHNGGMCHEVPAGVWCDCLAGSSGDTCQHDFDECASSPCQHGATCSTPQLNMFSCACVAGYTGETCETDIDECASNPCQQGGNCSTPHINMYTCDCAVGYIGHNCENVDQCNSSPCTNNGTCISNIVYYICLCVPRYQGRNCEFDAATCESQPCLNGGTCHSTLNWYKCDCTDGFNGDNCETSTLSERDGRQSSSAVIAASVSICVVVIVVVVILIVWKKRGGRCDVCGTLDIQCGEDSHSSEDDTPVSPPRLHEDSPNYQNGCEDSSEDDTPVLPLRLHEGTPHNQHGENLDSSEYNTSALPLCRHEGTPGKQCGEDSHSSEYNTSALTLRRHEGTPGNQRGEDSHIYYFVTDGNPLDPLHLEEGTPDNQRGEDSHSNEYNTSALPLRRHEGTPGKQCGEDSHTSKSVDPISLCQEEGVNASGKIIIPDKPVPTDRVNRMSFEDNSMETELMRIKVTNT